MIGSLLREADYLIQVVPAEPANLSALQIEAVEAYWIANFGIMKHATTHRNVIGEFLHAEVVNAVAFVGSVADQKFGAVSVWVKFVHLVCHAAIIEI